MRLLFYWLYYTIIVFLLLWRGGMWLLGKDARSVSHSFLATSTRRRLVIWRDTLDSGSLARGFVVRRVRERHVRLFFRWGAVVGFTWTWLCG
jgi:hypothetical protein